MRGDDCGESVGDERFIGMDERLLGRTAPVKACNRYLFDINPLDFRVFTGLTSRNFQSRSSRSVGCCLLDGTINLFLLSRAKISSLCIFIFSCYCLSEESRNVTSR